MTVIDPGSERLNAAERREARARAWLMAAVNVVALATVAYVIFRWTESGWIRTGLDAAMIGGQLVAVVGLVFAYNIGRKSFGSAIGNAVVVILFLLAIPALPAFAEWASTLWIS